MDVNNKLEVYRRVYCLGGGDIERIFKDDYRLEHYIGKYKHYRDKDGFFGNYSFLTYLDLDAANKMLNYVGFEGEFNLGKHKSPE